ncbi:hypothetical protein Tco_1491932 [Tanacetum coccineum]
MFNEYFNPPPIAVSPVQEAAAPRAEVLADSPVTTSIDQDAPSITNAPQDYVNIPIDVKRAFLIGGASKDEVYIFYIEGFVIRNIPSHVYSSKRLFMVLKQALRACLHSTNSVDIPMIENKKLDEDLQGKPVDATLYCGLIGSLMYLNPYSKAYRHVTLRLCRCRSQGVSRPLDVVKLEALSSLGDKLVSWLVKRSKRASADIE